MKLDPFRLEYYISPEQSTKQFWLDLDSIYQLSDEERLQVAWKYWHQPNQYHQEAAQRSIT